MRETITFGGTTSIHQYLNFLLGFDKERGTLIVHCYVAPFHGCTDSAQAPLYLEWKSTAHPVQVATGEVAAVAYMAVNSIPRSTVLSTFTQGTRVLTANWEHAPAALERVCPRQWRMFLRTTLQLDQPTKLRTMVGLIRQWCIRIWRPESEKLWEGVKFLIAIMYVRAWMLRPFTSTTTPAKSEDDRNKQ